MAAVVASGIFITAGWRSRQVRQIASSEGHDAAPHDPLLNEPRSGFSENSAPPDAAGALRVALKRLAPVMARQSVKAEIAAPFGLRVQLRGGTLAGLLEALIAMAIHGSLSGRLLLTAVRHGDRIHISITDDMPNRDAKPREAECQPLMERVVACGSELEIAARTGGGITMTLRLPIDDATRSDQAPCEDQNGIGSCLIAQDFTPAINFDTTH